MHPVLGAAGLVMEIEELLSDEGKTVLTGSTIAPVAIALVPRQALIARIRIVDLNASITHQLDFKNCVQTCYRLNLAFYPSTFRRMPSLSTIGVD